MKFLKFVTANLIGISLCASVYAKTTASEVADICVRDDVAISLSGPWIDKARAEVTMKLVGYSIMTPKEFALPANRSLVAQVYKPIKGPQSGNTKLPVILFSGGWGEDFRLYSTVLKNISARGYVIVNIDHYYYQNSQRHQQGYDEWVKIKRKSVESLSESQKQEQFMKTKFAALDIYSKDILFILEHFGEILRDEPRADLDKVVLMGHSIGGNADKSVIEKFSSSQERKNKIKAFVSFDSRLNQLGLKTSFEVPTLVLGAFSWYRGKNDPLRQLPPQSNLKLKVLNHTTHASFDDFSIFYVLGKNLGPLQNGMNNLAREELADDIKKVENGSYDRFGEPMFLGGKAEVIQFVNELSQTVDGFLKEVVK